MNRYSFTVFTLILALFYTEVFQAARKIARTDSHLQAKIRHLNQKLERAHLRLLVQQEQYQEYRQSVAAVLPPSVKIATQKGKDYPLRNLASVVTSKDGVKVKSLLASTLFQTGKSLFREGQYARANRLFQKLIDRYGYLTQAIEAHFLMAEGQYQLGDVEGATKTIGRMVDLFPEAELTGFAVVRLGNILEHKERYEEAIEMYRTALRSFPHRSVASAAESRLHELGR